MVDIRNIIRKLANNNNVSRSDSFNDTNFRQKVTPAEMELMRLRERERLDAVKSELRQVRSRHKFLQPKFQDSVLSNPSNSIIKQGNVFAGSVNPFSLGNGNNVLRQRSNLFFGR